MRPPRGSSSGLDRLHQEEGRKADPNGRNRTLDVVDGVIAKQLLPRARRPTAQKADHEVETRHILQYKIAANTRRAQRAGSTSYLHTFGEWAENDGGSIGQVSLASQEDRHRERASAV